MHPVTVGCRLDLSVSTYQALLDQALAAERTGYDTIWLRDHVSIEAQVSSPLAMECWTSMTALACHTERIRIGSQVICNGWRNPALLAKMASTLDVVAKGRLTLGIGIGDHLPEWEEYGFDVQSVRERQERLAESVSILRLMWTEPSPSFEGHHYRIRAAVNEPKPVQAGGPPIVIGAWGPKGLRNVAKLADGWNVLTNLEDFIRRREILDGFCEEIGRAPSSIEKYVPFSPIFAGDRSRAIARREALFERFPSSGILRRFSASGGPAEMLEYLQPFVAAGCRNFITFFYDPERCVEDIAAFGEEVIPLLPQLG